MSKYIFKRILMMIPVLIGVLFIVFTINHFSPGDPVASLLGASYTPEQYAAKEAELEANACDYEKYAALYAEKEAMDEQLLALMEKWEQLSEEAGE